MANLISFNIFSALHELLHTAGFFHEHTRHDRDRYIWIKWSKIRPRMKHNYYIADQPPHHTCPTGYPWYSTCSYDICSIMHYGGRVNMIVKCEAEV